jgi:tetratricopeptide (TPR) repeat protein
VGRHEDALTTLQEALELLQQLAAAHPEIYQGDLAYAIGNFGVALEEIGRQEEALATIQESADLFRQLAAVRPEVYGDTYNEALRRVRNLLQRLGRTDEMLDLREPTSPKSAMPKEGG